MKPNVFGYALSCCLLVLGACATHSHALYSTDKIPILSQDTTAKMDELSRAGADEVYELVKKNLTRLQEVLKLTGKDVPPHDKDRAQQITGLFKEMWEDYKEVASKAGPIELNMTQKLQELKALLTEPNNIIEDLEKELGGLKRELSTGIQEEDEARRAIREQSLQVQIAFLDGELKTWRTFREFQINTAKKAEDMRKMVSNLMLILAENANIYIRPQCQQPYIHRGSFQILADKLKIGWHPEFLARLEHLLSSAGIS